MRGLVVEFFANLKAQPHEQFTAGSNFYTLFSKLHKTQRLDIYVGIFSPYARSRKSKSISSSQSVSKIVWAKIDKSFDVAQRNDLNN